MTRRTNARLAGSMFLLYIAVALGGAAISSRATRGAEGMAAHLAAVARQATLIRLGALCSLLTFVVAVTLAVALYGLTRDEDHELAVLALSCRIAEGVLAAFPLTSLGMLWLATGSAVTDPATANALGAFLQKLGAWKTLGGSTCFAVGSTIFAWLFLRARSIPVPLAWLGVLGSALLVIGLPLQMTGFLSGSITSYMWIPVAIFEVVLAIWLLVRGVTPPQTAARDDRAPS